MYLRVRPNSRRKMPIGAKPEAISVRIAPAHVRQRFDLWCATEGEAKERAEQLVDGHDVELWHRDHRIETFRHEGTRASETK